jgi:hypothetical protein
MSLTSRASEGKEWTWRMYTAAVGGGLGVAPGGYEIWRYPPGDGMRMFAIRENGDTHLCPFQGNVFVNGKTVHTSDSRLKADVTPLAGVLSKLAGLRGVSYLARNNPAGGRQLGVIAQDVERVFPELVTVHDQDGYLAVDYQGITAVLVDAVKELATDVDRLRARLSERPA